METQNTEQDPSLTTYPPLNQSPSNSASGTIPKRVSRTSILFILLVCVSIVFCTAVIILREINQNKIAIPLSELPKKASTSLVPATPTPFSNIIEKTSKLEVSDVAQSLESGLKTEGKGYRITILPGWRVEQTQAFNYDTQYDDDVFIILGKNPGYNIRIVQGGSSGFRCVYEGDSVRDNTNDQLFEDYVDITDQDGHLYRRGRAAGGMPKDIEDSLRYDVCEYREEYPGDASTTVLGMYGVPTASYENITYKTENPPDESILKEMDQMLGTLKNISVEE